MKITRPAIIGFPFDEHSSYLRGAAHAPPLIRQALACPSSNMWTESGIDLGAKDAYFDAGDLDFSSRSDAFADIESAITHLLERNLKPISLGGDHSITYPVIRAFHKRYPRLSILHFDAHSDIYDVFEGNRLSHACPFARIMEEGLVERLVQVGIRTLSRHQRDQVARFGVEVCEMKDWSDDIRFEFRSPLYISFDMDGLDPACSPGVSHPEPGGLTVRQAVGVIQSLKACVVGADIVEFNPARDVSGITAMTCAKLLKEIAARTLEQGEGKD